MERRKRVSTDGNVGSAKDAEPIEHAACVVCGTRDGRLLVMVELRGGVGATLCGSHALLHSRMSEPCRSVTELRAALRDRREMDRRAPHDPLSHDELAERLTAAFTRDRRGSERRAS